MGTSLSQVILGYQSWLAKQLSSVCGKKKQTVTGLPDMSASIKPKLLIRQN